MDIFKFPYLEQLFTDGTFTDSDFIYQDRKGIRTLRKFIVFEKIRYIASTIYTNYYYKDQHELKHLESRLNAETLKSVIGDEYSFIIELMVKKGILKCTKKTKFINGQSQQSSIYKINFNIKGAKQVGEDNKYMLKRESFVKAFNTEDEKLDSISAYLQAYTMDFDKNRIQFHTDAYKALNSFKKEIYNKRTDEYSLEYGFHKYSKAKFTLENILEEGFNRFSFDSQHARFFTSFHSLPSDLRDYLILDGVPTVSIDIKNSQWQTLCNYYIDKKLGGSLENASSSELLFIKMCQTGHLYEYFMPVTGKDRKFTKGKMLNWLYANIGQCYHDPKIAFINAAFKKDFPEIFEFIRLEKRGVHGHKYFARRIQLMEANVVKKIQYDIVSRMGKDCFTVHDSFSVKMTDKEVIEYIKEELVKFNYHEIEVKDNFKSFSDYKDKSKLKKITYSADDLIYNLEEISSDIEKILVQYENSLNLEKSRDPIPKSEDDFNW